MAVSAFLSIAFSAVSTSIASEDRVERGGQFTREETPPARIYSCHLCRSTMRSVPQAPWLRREALLALERLRACCCRLREECAGTMSWTGIRTGSRVLRESVQTDQTFVARYRIQVLERIKFGFWIGRTGSLMVRRYLMRCTSGIPPHGCNAVRVVERETDTWSSRFAEAGRFV